MMMAHSGPFAEPQVPVAHDAPMALAAFHEPEGLAAGLVAHDAWLLSLISFTSRWATVSGSSPVLTWAQNVCSTLSVHAPAGTRLMACWLSHWRVMPPHSVRMGSLASHLTYCRFFEPFAHRWREPVAVLAHGLGVADDGPEQLAGLDVRHGRVVAGDGLPQA